MLNPKRGRRTPKDPPAAALNPRRWQHTEGPRNQQRGTPVAQNHLENVEKNEFEELGRRSLRPAPYFMPMYFPSMSGNWMSPNMDDWAYWGAEAREEAAEACMRNGS